MFLGKFKNKKGVYALLALDHRGSLKSLIKTTGKKKLVEWKRTVLENVAGEASGVLVDADYGLPAYRAAEIERPLLLAIEKSGYKGGDKERKTELQFTAKKLNGLGAEAVKLLVYYNPKLKAAEHQEKIIKKVARECEREEVPFLLEIVTYAGGKRMKKEEMVLESLKRVQDLGVRVDIYKLEYPGSVEGCRKITAMLKGTPWILLSAGVDYKIFKKQVETATANGAEGFLAGRALWQDGARKKDLDKFMMTVAAKRLREITRIAENNLNLSKNWFKNLFN